MTDIQTALAGWTMSRIKLAGKGPVTFDGGPLDGLATFTPALKSAHDGEVWCVYTSFEGDNAAFAWGGITGAHLTCEPVAQRFLTGETFPTSPRCPCD